MKIIETKNPDKLIYAWIDDVPVEESAINLMKQVTELPFVEKTCLMPDAHAGIGCSIGSVIALKGAICPSLVGVDISCGMNAIPLNLTINDIPKELWKNIRRSIENKIPTGRSDNGGPEDIGAWHSIPERVREIWNAHLKDEFESICKKYPSFAKSNNINHLGSLGTGNHFIELCKDDNNKIWLMLHSGSRGVGNKIGSYFIRLAKDDYKKDNKELKQKLNNEKQAFVNSAEFKNLERDEKKKAIAEIQEKNKKILEEAKIALPSPDLAYFLEGTELYDDYFRCIQWCQNFAKYNRQIMVELAIEAIQDIIGEFTYGEQITCHHNFVEKEIHNGKELLVTRKGAIMAHKGTMGIIPGAMGRASFIVKGKGCEAALCSASHGAGRVMGRKEARRKLTLEDHLKATENIECIKDESVLDETPSAYKNVEDVMKAQKDLVEIIARLEGFICIKGTD